MYGHHRHPKFSVREIQQKYKDLYANSNKGPENFYKKNVNLKNPNLIAILGRFLPAFFFPDSLRIEPLLVPWLSTFLIKIIPRLNTEFSGAQKIESNISG